MSAKVTATKVTTTRAGELTVRVVDASERAGAPSLLVVLCHGYGAPGTDLVGIAGELYGAFPSLAGVRFAFPEAPLALEDMPFEGRAWWHIDVTRFARAMASGDPDDVAALMDDIPEGMPKARKQLMAAVDVLQAQTPGAPLVLGGFSQGAMIATDVTLRRDEPPAALAIFSGTLLCRPEWSALVGKRRGLDVVQTHGTHDPLLPFAVAGELRALLSNAGLNVRFHSFPGGHGLDGGCLRLFAQLLGEKLASVDAGARGAQ